MGHPNGEAFDFEMLFNRMHAAKFMSVNVAIHGSVRLQGGQCVAHSRRANVAGVPNFIALTNVMGDAFVVVAVRVG